MNEMGDLARRQALVVLLLGFVCLGAALKLSGQSTNALNLRVRTDANDSLLAVSQTYVSPDGPPTNLANLRLRTDANDYLIVTNPTGFADSLPNGSAAAPSLSFASDTDTGIYRTFENFVGFSAGGVFAAEIGPPGVFLTFSGCLNWESGAAGSTDLTLCRDAANELGQRTGTNAQTFNLYETFTDASNYERAALTMGANALTIAMETAGTGADDMSINWTAAGLGAVTATGRFAYSTRQAATVDAATSFAATSSYVLLACTGAETINTITGGVSGMELVLEHTDTDCTIADDDDATAADAIDLTGTATNDIGAVNKMITLRYNGTYWLQVSESDN